MFRNFSSLVESSEGLAISSSQLISSLLNKSDNEIFENEVFERDLVKIANIVGKGRGLVSTQFVLKETILICANGIKSDSLIAFNNWRASTREKRYFEIPAQDAFNVFQILHLLRLYAMRNIHSNQIEDLLNQFEILFPSFEQVQRIQGPKLKTAQDTCFYLVLCFADVVDCFVPGFKQIFKLLNLQGKISTNLQDNNYFYPTLNSNFSLQNNQLRSDQVLIEDVNLQAELSSFQNQVIRAKLMLDLNGHTEGCFPRSAFLNHSCIPNCKVQMKNGQLVIITSRDVQPEEEFCISYVKIDEEEGEEDPTLKEKKRKYLNENFLFDCYCQKCIH